MIFDFIFSASSPPPSIMARIPLKSDVTVGPFFVVAFGNDAGVLLVKDIFFFFTDAFVADSFFELADLLLPDDLPIDDFTADFEELIPSATDCFGPLDELAKSSPPEEELAVARPDVDETFKLAIPGAFGPTKCESAIPLLVNAKYRPSVMWKDRLSK